MMPRRKMTWAAKRSVVFLGVNLMKMMAGNKTQTTLPMVDPTNPRTNSMSGIMMPTIKVMAMTLMVMMLKCLGGI